MNNYTRGKWDAFRDGMGGMVIRCGEREMAKILTFQKATDGAESQAYARLIAAAPDLFAACLTVETWLVAPDLSKEVIDEMRSVLKTALAKTKGR